MYIDQYINLNIKFLQVIEKEKFMSLSHAVESVLIKNYSNFSGRARRSEYWYWILFAFIVGIILAFISGFIGPIGIIMQPIWGLGTLIPGIAVGVRRLHDINKSGWWLLLLFAILIGWIILLIWSIKTGTDGSNDYGDDPKK